MARVITTCVQMILVIMFVNACRQHEINPGWDLQVLSLPPGSTVVDRIFDDQEWRVYFNNNRTWNEVWEHVNSRLKPAGFICAMEEGAFDQQTAISWISTTKPVYLVVLKQNKSWDKYKNADYEIDVAYHE